MIGVSEKIGKIKIMNIYCKEKANGDKRSICLIDDDLETIKQQDRQVMMLGRQ